MPRKGSQGEFAVQKYDSVACLQEILCASLLETFLLELSFMWAREETMLDRISYSTTRSSAEVIDYRVPLAVILDWPGAAAAGTGADV
jgi:hypothetical protein